MGTLYKQVGKNEALMRGLEFVGPKMAMFARHATSLALEGRIKLYCWRGGQRSQSMGWLFEKAGLQPRVLQGGYRQFRRSARERISLPWKIAVVGGFTGSGKTEILRALRQMGEQVLDLEGLAHHRGSAFGAIGQPPQPSTEQFLNLIWRALDDLDPGRTLWVEDESHLVGRAAVPDELFNPMREARLYFLEAPRALRVVHLTALYGVESRAELAAAVQRIQKRLGGRDAAECIAQIEAGELAAVAERLLHYYDKQYAHGAGKRDPERVTHLRPEPEPTSMAQWVEQAAQMLITARNQLGSKI
ncbi:putative tRNA 2-selenouridine synthase [Magnetofaba australis IT-1]|uniref:Putative tRNA 2-selenouridine synthase n=1 Tax=Magnetofaba australis IT-1 TaxID=1434232 RepID=A0A1Y2K062_9PROT|nr:putative tRNA 2-selenouridine synthase [Magnetofaba australis IT-1]